MHFGMNVFDLQDLDAVAVSMEPGLTLSLKVGLDHAKKLAQTAKYVIYTFTRVKTPQYLVDVNTLFQTLSCGPALKCIEV